MKGRRASRRAAASRSLADRHHAAGDDVERAEPGRPRRQARFERLRPHAVGELGNVEHRDPAVGGLRRRRHRARHERRPPDGDVGPQRLVDELQRLPEARPLARRQRDGHRRAVIAEDLPAQHGPDDVDDLADARDRTLVGDSVKALDHLRPRCPEPEEEPPAGDVVAPGRRHAEQRGGAGVDVQDADADLYPLSQRRQVPDLADGVERISLGDEYGIKADRLHRRHLPRRRADVTCVLDLGSELHDGLNSLFHTPTR